MQDGLLRVEGRISRPSLPYEAKHQILVPPKSPRAIRILEDVDRRIEHLGDEIRLLQNFEGSIGSWRLPCW